MLLTNNEQISAEEFDTEIVVIHFLEGTYFSLRGASMALWSWLQTGADETTLARLLCARYGLDAEAGRMAVAKAVETMRQRGLIVEVDGAGSPLDAYDVAAGPDDYQEAVVEAFDDLQELIAIDPVHEVDPMQGWPHRPSPVKLDD